MWRLRCPVRRRTAAGYWVSAALLRTARLGSRCPLWTNPCFIILSTKTLRLATTALVAKAFFLDVKSRHVGSTIMMFRRWYRVGAVWQFNLALSIFEPRLECRCTSCCRGFSLAGPELVIYFTPFTSATNKHTPPPADTLLRFLYLCRSRHLSLCRVSCCPTLLHGVTFPSLPCPTLPRPTRYVDGFVCLSN